MLKHISIYVSCIALLYYKQNVATLRYSLMKINCVLPHGLSMFTSSIGKHPQHDSAFIS